MAIRKLETVTNDKGHKAVIYKDSDFGEYVIRFHTPLYNHDADYFTDGAIDAIDTAKNVLGVK